MLRKISKDEQALINEIKSNLPTNVYFVEQQVTIALELAKKYLYRVKRRYDNGDSIYLHSLRVASEISKYAKQVSQVGFYRYDLVITALLHDIIEDADCEELRKDLDVFKTTINNPILENIEALSNNLEEMEKLGRAKYMTVKFVKLSKNKDLFVIKLMDRIDNLACIPLIDVKNDEQQLFIQKYLLESLVIYNNLCMIDYTVPNDIYLYYKEFTSLLLSEFKF